jgi:hypothetical protein
LLKDSHVGLHGGVPWRILSEFAIWFPGHSAPM